MPGLGLVGGLLAAIPEDLVDLGRGHGDRGGGDDQLDGLHGARPDLDLRRRTVLDQLACLDPLDQGRREAEDPIEPQNVRHEVVGEHRQRPDVR